MKNLMYITIISTLLTYILSPKIDKQKKKLNLGGTKLQKDSNKYLLCTWNELWMKIKEVEILLLEDHVRIREN